jgi:hypothetical protein
VKDIRRATRKHHSAEEKIRIVLEGLRGEYSIAELCRREEIAESLYYSWSKEFLEAASGVEWTKARHRMNNAHGHLQDILNYCYARRWPLLTAIIVQKGKVLTGDMDEFTLRGFCDGCRELGLDVGPDENEYLRRCQNECFLWAQKEDPDLHSSIDHP